MTAPSLDDERGDVELRRARERAAMSRCELAARAAKDALDPMPHVDVDWISCVEEGTNDREVSFREWQTLGRSLQPPRPDWWEEGYEHDLYFAWSGHREPEEREYDHRQYWARVRTVAEERDRRYRAQPDPQQELAVLCELLSAYRVDYVLVGSAAALPHGVALETQDVDLVPSMDAQNLERLCEAINVLGPRWAWGEEPRGKRIDGGRLEPRHFQQDTVALGLVTRLGRIDLVLRPRGFERGYEALAPNAVTRRERGVALQVAGLDDLIRSKELLDRPKDRRQLPALYRHRDELRTGDGA